MNLILRGVCVCGIAAGSTSSSRQIYRHIETYSEHFLSSLSEWERQLLVDQEMSDAINDMYTPDMDNVHESYMEYSQIGLLDLGDIVHQGRESVIYKVYNHPGMLVKYQANCDEIRNGTSAIHPLVYDFAFMKEAHKLGIAPEPVLLSPASLLQSLESFGRNRKFFFSITKEELSKCIQQRGSVRYMVMREAFGTNLHAFRNEFPDGIVPLADATNIMIDLMETLKTLHEIGGIIHGDIHVGNIMVDIDHGVQLIDFGRARRDNRTLSNDRVLPPGISQHQLFSPWQMDGRLTSRRDDVYRALHTFAVIINPQEYLIREDVNLKFYGPINAIFIKRHSFIFWMPPPVMFHGMLLGSTFCPLAASVGGDHDRIGKLINTLQYIQQNATIALDDINAPIPYNLIVSDLFTVLNITE